jgi:hypothetical protein
VKRLREIQAEIESMDETFNLSELTEEASRDADQYRPATPRAKAEINLEIIYKAAVIRKGLDWMEQQCRTLRYELNRLCDLIDRSK